MAMMGHYTAIEELLLNQILDGEKDIFDIDPRKYQTLDIDIPLQVMESILRKDIEKIEPSLGYVFPIRDGGELDCEADFEPFYITAKQVKEASQFLNSLDDSTLENMHESMLKNGIAQPCDMEFFYEYIFFYLAELREYFNQTAEKGDVTIFYAM